MNKIIKKVKEKDIDVIILIAFSVIILANSRRLLASDELWNFANIYKMNNGYTIYNDLNVIVTPLFFIIGEILFKILGGNFFVFTLYNVIIYITLFMLVYKILINLTIPKRRAVVYLLGIIILFEIIILAGANYNKLALIPILIAIMLLIKKKDNPYMLGVLCFLTFLTKQNIGAYFIIGLLVYMLFTKKRKNIIKILITFLILLIVFIFVMCKAGVLYSFVNYAIMSIKEFGEDNITMVWTYIPYICVVIFVIGTSIYVIKSKKINLTKRIKENILILLSIGAPLLLIAYPIFNYAHITMSFLIIIIEFLYIIDKMLISEMIKNIKKEKIIYFILILLYIIELLYYMFCYIQLLVNNKTELITDNSNPYYGIYVDKDTKKNIDNICSFIKENEKQGIEVKVLSYKAQLYMIVLNENNRNFDLPLVGNFGKDGEQGLINQINECKNTKILIQTNEEDMFWQESKKVRQYIKDNFEKQGIIEDFDIYYIK